MRLRLIINTIDKKTPVIIQVFFYVNFYKILSKNLKVYQKISVLIYEALFVQAKMRGEHMAQINSINAADKQVAMLGMQPEENLLSETTQKELEALGIPVTEGMTEAQAQQKILEVKQERQALQAENELPTDVELMADVKTLAGQIGVAYSEDQDTEEILINISEELEAQIDDAENNPQELSTLMGYFNRLKGLDSLFDEIQDVQNKIYTAMDIVATSKKRAHGFE